MSRIVRLAILAAAGLCCPSLALAQTVWTRLLAEGQALPGADALPGFSANETVRNNGFRELKVIPNGAFAGSVTTDPAASFGFEDWYLYGSSDRGATVGALRREGLFDSQTQTSFGSPVGIDSAGNLVYRANVGAGSGVAGLWRNDDLLFSSGDAITAGPLAGSFYSGFTWTSVSPAGVASWVSDYAASSGGAVVGGALFRDAATQQALLKTGDAIGAGLTVGPGFLASNLAWSQLATKYLSAFEVTDGVTLQEVVLLNGVPVVTAGGGVLRERDPIPAAAGGLPNETWALGSLFDVNEAGDWIVSASAQIGGVGNTTDDFLVVNGVIRYRDGQVVDGHVLSGLPSDVSLNDRGDVAFVWDNKVFLNDEIIAEVGGPVDTNGDGAGDVTLSNLFDVDLTNLPSADGGPLLYLQARTGSTEVVLRNRPVTIPGDYNGDGAVDGADYTVYRDTLGSELLLGADGDGDDIVDAGDLAAWAAAYGGPAAPATSIPEPSSLAVGIAAVALASPRRQAKR